MKDNILKCVGCGHVYKDDLHPPTDRIGSLPCPKCGTGNNPNINKKGRDIMSNGKSTPGPWNYYGGNVFTVVASVNSENDTPITRLNNEANARLIAAAPALLDACKKVKRYKEEAEAGRIDPDNGHEYWESVMSYVQFAIALTEKEG